jgi:uncharacterized Zn-finger protein
LEWRLTQCTAMCTMWLSQFHELSKHYFVKLNICRPLRYVPKTDIWCNKRCRTVSSEKNQQADFNRSKRLLWKRLICQFAFNVIMASYKCTKCDKSYRNRTTLTAHQRMHNGTAFACDLCLKRFDRKAALKRHRIVHTFAKPYACDVDGCEKKFTQNSDMLKHKGAVHKKVPGKYRCEECDYVFTNSGNLRRHRQTHTGERPFACTDCDRKFAQKSNLQQHFDVKHSLERPVACCALRESVCDSIG